MKKILIGISAAAVMFIIVYFVYRKPRSHPVIDVRSVSLEKS